MKWEGRRESRNVEDRRHAPGAGIAVGGVGLVIALVVTLLTGDPTALVKTLSSQTRTPQTQHVSTQEDRELVSFVSVVLADTEDVWTQLFKENSDVYNEPTLVLFSDHVQSACGSASSQVGPFYCPADQKVYIDLSFQKELRDRYHAAGDFAMAYVVAHEVGHHVQNLLGISTKVHNERGRLSEKEYNKLVKRLELQADFFAGVWAHYQDQNNLLDSNDIEEALTAASAIGDDRLQKQARGYVVPDSFTHGTSDQRVRWFYKGYTSGRMQDGNTFKLSEKQL